MKNSKKRKTERGYPFGLICKTNDVENKLF